MITRDDLLNQTKENLLETDEIWSESDFEAAYITLNRGKDGEVYLVKWWHGMPNIVTVVEPIKS